MQSYLKKLIEQNLSVKLTFEKERMPVEKIEANQIFLHFAQTCLILAGLPLFCDYPSFRIPKYSPVLRRNSWRMFPYRINWIVRERQQPFVGVFLDADKGREWIWQDF